jgi:hypothetical protein
MTHPCIPKSGGTHLLLRLHNSTCNINATRWLRQILTLLDHPLILLIADEPLEWLVVTDINRLGETSAARRGDYDLNTKVVDGSVDGSHLMNAEVDLGAQG